MTHGAYLERIAWKSVGISKSCGHVVKRTTSPITTQKVMTEEKKRILITGAAGFIGSHVAETLLRRGDYVIIVDDMNDYYDTR
jgi:FlaA1/EpsC-like NDP-sugar epimerase